MNAAQALVRRSFASSYSNLLLFSALDLRRHLADFAVHRLPLESLPQFLHEMTHHWCFCSPLGTAVATASMRARRTAVRAALTERSLTDRQKDSVLRDMIRAQVTLELMRPLAEGLALFMEHDAVPGKSAIITRPMMSAAAFYTRWEAPEQMLERLPVALQLSRSAESHVRRKASLLAEPLRTRNGGYLPGYLLVKALREFALGASSLFADADFFAHFLKSFFYDDWRLVEAVLDERANEWTLPGVIGTAFQRRLAEFVETDRAANADEFEDRNLNHQPDQFEHRSGHLQFGLNSHPVEPVSGAHRGKELLDRAFHELFETSNDPLELSLIARDLDFLELRHACTLGEGRFEARVTEHRMLHVGRVEGITDRHFPAYVSGAPDGLPAGWEGTLGMTLLYTDAPRRLVLTFWTDEGPVGAHVLGRAGEAPPVCHSVLASRELRGRFEEDTFDVLRRALDDDIVANVVLRDFGERFDEFVSDIYLPKALSFTPAGSLPGVIETMSDDGFLPVLGRKTEDLLRLAASSLGTSNRLRFPGEESRLHEHLGSEARRLSAVILAGAGFDPFLFHDGEAIYSRV